MTRINLVPPIELCDQHLLAEFRELTRIPNVIISGRFSFVGMPDRFTLGTGHVKFFYNKLCFLDTRYDELYLECLRRKFNVTHIFPSRNNISTFFYKSYFPTSEDIEISRQRLREKLPVRDRWTNSVKPDWY